MRQSVKEGCTCTILSVLSAAGCVAQKAAGESRFTFAGWISRIPTFVGLFGVIWLALLLVRCLMKNHPVELICNQCRRTSVGDKEVACLCGGKMEDADWYE